MPPLRRAASGGGGGGDAALIGAQDAAASINGAYWSDDLMGNTPILTAGILSGTGGGGYGYGTPGGVPTIPTGWAASDFAGHPGIGIFSTSALNDVGGYQLGTQQINIQNAGSPGWTWTAMLAAPQALSNATDRYQMIVGPCLVGSSGPTHGWGVSYTDNAGSGYFQLIEYQSATMGPQVIATCGTGPSAKGWFIVQIVIKGVAMTLNVRALGNSTVYSASGNSYLLNQGASYGVGFAALGAWMKRTAFSAGTQMAFVDRVSFSLLNLART